MKVEEFWAVCLCKGKRSINMHQPPTTNHNHNHNHHQLVLLLLLLLLPVARRPADSSLKTYPWALKGVVFDCQTARSVCPTVQPYLCQSPVGLPVLSTLGGATPRSGATWAALGYSHMVINLEDLGSWCHISSAYIGRKKSWVEARYGTSCRRKCWRPVLHDSLTLAGWHKEISGFSEGKTVKTPMIRDPHKSTTSDFLLEGSNYESTVRA